MLCFYLYFLTQVDTVGSSKGFTIAGYYTANETLDDMR